MENINSKNIVREYNEWLVLVFIREVLEKAQDEDINWKNIIYNIAHTKEINDILNDTNFFVEFNSNRLKRLPGITDYIVNIDSLRTHFIELLWKEIHNYFNLSYQDRLLETFFSKYSEKMWEVKTIKYPNEFDFSELDFQNIDYIKTILWLENKNFLKISNINSGYIIPEDEKEAEEYSKKNFFQKIVRGKKECYLTFDIGVSDGILEFWNLRIDPFNRTLKIWDTLIFQNWKSCVNEEQVIKWVYLLYALLTVGERTDTSITISDDDVDKFIIEFNKARKNLWGNSKVQFEDFTNSELTRWTSLLQKYWKNCFTVGTRKNGSTTITLNDYISLNNKYL